MTPIKKRLPRDTNERAKSITDIVAAISEGDHPETLSERTGKDPERVARKLGGAKGGAIRAANLSPQRRVEIARKAAAARWSKPEG